MKLRYLITFLSILISPSGFSAEIKILHSSVSPEFRHGLHEKYLQYLADKLDMELSIMPMPFARRLVALRKGEIDLMVGLKESHLPGDEFIYLQPSYESLGNTYFILKKNRDRLRSEDDLRKLIMGITIDDAYHYELATSNQLQIVPVTALRQKIEMLALERIEVFAHFTGSAEVMIDDLGYADTMIAAPFQRANKRNYHVAISTASDLISRRKEIEGIIRQAVRNGDFEAIRADHYQP